MESIITLLTTIISSSGILGLLAFVSIALNSLLMWFLYKLKFSEPMAEKAEELCNIKIQDIEKINSDQLKKIESLMFSIKQELELNNLKEYQPLREMLIKITASIELLAKTIEYAANHDRQN